RKPAADSIQARFGSRSHAAGLQLLNESFAHLSFSVNRIIVVMRSGRLLGVPKCGGSQEEKKLHRNSVRRRIPLAMSRSNLLLPLRVQQSVIHPVVTSAPGSEAAALAIELLS